MRRYGKWAWAMVLTAALLAVGSVRAEDGEKADGAVPAPCACLFPFGVRAPGPSDAKATQAVAKGLRWLAAHQAAGGLWQVANLGWCDGKKGREDLVGKGKALYDSGVTGMTICAFLCAGHSHESGTHAAVVAKALAALVALQDHDGCIGSRSAQHYIYNHAFGALALVEAFGETGDTRLLAPARKALAFSELARNPNSAWRYGIKPGDNDTSATGCMTLPFYAAQRVNDAAEAAGREPPFVIDDATFEGVRAWIDHITDPDYGRTGYIQKGGAPARPQELIDIFPGDQSEACTGIGVFLRAVLPGGNTEEDAALLRKGTRVLLQCLPKWTPGAGNIDLYYWYYGSLAMHAIGGSGAETWRRALEGALIAGQRRDGDPCAYAGSWDTDCPWGPDGGRVYTTAMAVLSLQAPHRFVRTPPDRSDLADALQTEGTDLDTTVRLLRALAIYRPASASRALLPHASATDPRVRAAAAAALARCEPSADAVKALGKLLGDASAAVQREAAAGLAQLGKRAAPTTDALLAALANEDADVRRHALRALGGLPDAAAAAVDRIRIRLTDPSPRVSIAAAGLLRRLQPADAESEAILLAGLELKGDDLRAEAAAGLGEADALSDAAKQALEQRLGDDSPRVQAAAARGLVATGTDPAALLEIVEPCLGSADLETRRLALELAERLGPKAASVVELVSAAALRGATPVRVAAVRALVAMGTLVPGAVAVLYTVRRDAPLPVRDAAREGLERIGADGAALVAALVPSLGSTWAEIVTGAVEGLAEQGSEAVEPLRAVLLRGNIAEQVAALRALTAIGPKAADAVSDVEQVLDSGAPPAVLARAALFLGAVCRRARCAIPRLAELAAAGHPEVRRASIQALGSLGDVDRKAIDALGKVATLRKKEDRRARIEALRALARLGPKAKPALSALRLALSSSDGGVRAAAVEGMAAVGKPALPHLMTAMGDQNDGYAGAAMEALGKMGPAAKKAVPKLVAALPSAARRANWGPASALAGIGKPSVRSLVTLLKEGAASTRHQAAWALGQIGKDAKSAVSTLKRALKDDKDYVREAAKQALEKIRGK